MPTHSINHFNLRAPQPLLNQLKDFYVNVVGMKVGWRPPFTFPGYWLYLENDAVLHLVETPSGSPEPSKTAGTFDHVAFSCSGLKEFEARLRDIGVVYKKASVSGTAQQQLFVRDPSGNGVEFNFAGSDVSGLLSIGLSQVTSHESLLIQT
jgi:glyoxylase I family protein